MRSRSDQEVIIHRGWLKFNKSNRKVILQTSEGHHLEPRPKRIHPKVHSYLDSIEIRLGECQLELEVITYSIDSLINDWLYHSYSNI